MSDTKHDIAGLIDQMTQAIDAVRPGGVFSSNSKLSAALFALYEAMPALTDLQAERDDAMALFHASDKQRQAIQAERDAWEARAEAAEARAEKAEGALARREDMHECAMAERDDATLYANEQKARAETAEENVGILQARREALERQVAQLQRELANARGLGPRGRAEAAVTRAYERGRDDAAKALDTCGDSAVTEALGQRLCCNGHHCGCQGADVGAFLLHCIRALTPPADLAKGVADE